MKTNKKYPLVPVLKELFRKYSEIMMVENPLLDLIEIASNDEKLKHLAGLAQKKCILKEIAPCLNLNIDEKGIYLYKFNPEDSALDKYFRNVSLKKEILKYYPEKIDVSKFRQGILDYIQTALYIIY